MQSLANRLGCAHLAVYAPAMFAELIRPAPERPAGPEPWALIRNVLWPMVREGGEQRILNRVRLRSGAPLLPYRFVVCPLLDNGSVLGIIVGLRDREARAFDDPELTLLTETAPAVLEWLRERTEAATGLDIQKIGMMMTVAG